MYKLKVKRTNQTALTTYYFKTLQEVADRIARICEGSELQKVLETQKEFNFRFYISFSNNY